ncbi:MAG: FkbM family methyltransferase [Caldisericum sp.]|jgi:FkbM family methyltransferase|uniref:FkbM family methyltransferase n=2 Tax=Caldisericum sp. TaxID=2499687 RepID=UPI003D0FE4F1
MGFNRGSKSSILSFNVNDSHTVLLIEDAFEKVQEFNFRRYLDELPHASLYARSRVVNQTLERFGLHLMHKSSYETFRYSVMGKWSSVGTSKLAIEEPEEFDKIYSLLEDDDSKSTFDWFIKYRFAYALIGNLANKIFPPKLSEDEFIRSLKSLRINKQGLVRIGSFSFKADPIGIGESWLLEQYYHDKCEVTEGDIVIDGGAFLGETAFWFISKGAAKVYAFEPDPSNYKVLLENIKRNNAYDKIIPKSILLGEINGNGSLYSTGTSRSFGYIKGNVEVEALTLDSFIEKEKLGKIDFIKLDVEGAEMATLRGAVETIKQCKPKMAISVYHKPEDIIEIQKFLHSLLTDAKFYLSHKFFDWNETILFVNPRR